jgi:transposase
VVGYDSHMRPHGTPIELENRRRLAVERVQDGYSTREVAEFLGVSDRAVRGWVAAFRDGGDQSLGVRPASGRPPKLTDDQEAVVLGWLDRAPSELGFATDLWTAPRVGELIRRRWGVRFNHRYLADWLRRRGLTPQKPARVPRERDPRAIAAWVRDEWPRIQKKRAGGRRT